MARGSSSYARLQFASTMWLDALANGFISLFEDAMGSCKTIMIVEDDEGIREALKLTLEFAGYKVETAENGKIAIERLANIETPCLILLDLMMPVMDGWAFAAVMKKEMMLAAIPIVVVTAFAERAQSVGAARIIKKPVDPETLLRFVREYCG